MKNICFWATFWAGIGLSFPHFAQQISKEEMLFVRDSTNTPICAGENHYLAHGFRKLLKLGAVDIIMPDLQKCGGLGEAQRIANLANLY